MFRERIQLLKRELRRFDENFLKTIAYLLAKKYVDNFRGENNSIIKSNGEFWVIRNYIEGNVVFDVGANMGEWTKFVLTHHPTCVVHCFEPSSFTFKKLQANNIQGQIFYRNLALGSRPGTAGLHIYEEGSGVNSLYLRQGVGGKPKKTENVQMNTLDNYCRENNVNRIDYLKLDVEGNEMDILRGAENMLKQGAIEKIQFEYGGCNIDARVLLKDLFEFLMPLKFSIYKIMPTRLKYIPKYDQDLENFQTANFLAFLTK